MSSAPPYPETTVPLTNPQTVPFNSGPQPVYPNQNVPGQYSPLLKQGAPPQSLPPGAVNAMPRTYQQPFWARPYGGDRKMVYIIVGIVAVVVILFLVVFLVVFFTVFNKASSEFDEAQKSHDEFVRKNFPDHRW
ncbi:hypothetical protein ILUMI_02125 [Ignelater luminosus]|uniref:Uncharacterized protein n=1 Tax=Ignelater luminosus TaxID=2038154 RepID=A0A8K0DD87_IGNLU|nr:hypothetical protein ILUMI_02125 [Ignelater luminosus]